MTEPHQLIKTRLSKWERLERAAQGEPVDRTPISFWRHFPDADQDPRSLADALVAFQRRYDLDLVKLMPSGMYSVVDYGVTVGPGDPLTGAQARTGGAIALVGDLLKLPPVSPSVGCLAGELEVLRNVRRTLGWETPIVETLFSPLTMLAKMSPRPLGETLDELGQQAHAVLSRLADDVIVFATACLDEGADGFFFATQWAVARGLSPGIYEEYGVPYDKTILQALRSRSRLLMLHLHGDFPLFSLADAYGVDWINWEDRHTLPSLAAGAHETTCGLAGGIPRFAKVLDNDAELSSRYVRDAVVALGGRRLMIAPGCVLQRDTPEHVMDALRQAVEPSDQPTS